MQMNLFVVEESVTKPKSAKRKSIARVIREQVMLIDRPAPVARVVEMKPEIIDPMDVIEEDIERWDGLY